MMMKTDSMGDIMKKLVYVFLVGLATGPVVTFGMMSQKRKAPVSVGEPAAKRVLFDELSDESTSSSSSSHSLPEARVSIDSSVSSHDSTTSQEAHNFVRLKRPNYKLEAALKSNWQDVPPTWNEHMLTSLHADAVEEFGIKMPSFLPHNFKRIYIEQKSYEAFTQPMRNARMQKLSE